MPVSTELKIPLPPKPDVRTRGNVEARISDCWEDSR